MSCFKLPTTLCNEIKIMICKFWWGQRGDRRKVHWVKWSKLCRTKNEEGMGFHELQKFNDTLLAKQVWRLASNQNSLFFRFFKAKFFPNGSVLFAKEKNGSYAWRSILKCVKSLWGVWGGGLVMGLQSKSTKINGLLAAEHGRIISPISDITSDALVFTLIDHDLCI